MPSAALVAESVLRCHLKGLILIAAGRLPPGYKVEPSVNSMTATQLRNAVDDYTSLLRRK